MKNSIVAIIVCILAYLFIKLCLGDISIESDTYGYEKNGKLNKRGLISIVTDTKRLLPRKTEQTTVVNIDYSYEPENDPKPILNYYHVVDQNEVDFYKTHQQEVAARFILSQCENKDIVEMTKKLEKYTVSFYDGNDFIFRIDIDAKVCEEVVNPKNENQNKTDKNLSNIINLMNSHMPIKTTYGYLKNVELSNSNEVIFQFFVYDSGKAFFLKNIEEIKKTTIKSYCSNKDISKILAQTNLIRINYFDEQKNFLNNLELTYALCKKML